MMVNNIIEERWKIQTFWDRKGFLLSEEKKKKKEANTAEYTLGGGRCLRYGLNGDMEPDYIEPYKSCKRDWIKCDINY